MKKILFFVAIFVALEVAASNVLAQTGVQTTPQGTNPIPAGPTALPAAAAPPPPPVVDPTKELKGPALVDALRKGGFVLYMRHTETGIVTEKCDSTNLSAVGEENARSVGAALQDLNIPIGAVRSSQPCRCVGTARLLGLGEVDITEDLNPVPPRDGFDISAARARRLAEIPPYGTNTVLVSHLHGARNKDEWLHLQMGEIIVFRPEASPRAEPVARIPLAGWVALKKAMSAGAVVR